MRFSNEQMNNETMNKSLVSMNRPILLLLVPILLSGCAVVGAAADKVMGPSEVKAKYVPPQEPMLVIAESFQHPSETMVESEQLVQKVAEQLKEHKVVPLVDSAAPFNLKASKPEEYHQMTIAQIGRTLGAKQVLYIDIAESNVFVAQASEMLKGKAVVRVRVVDAETGNTKWPEEGGEGYPLVVETPMLREGQGVDESAVRLQLQEVMGEKIAQLFYTYKPG
jgi:PBP1b-binding outer membrane lipoprotein LpoB